eukprot:3128989-Prymnesium_polylepis.1
MRPPDAHAPRSTCTLKPAPQSSSTTKLIESQFCNPPSRGGRGAGGGGTAGRADEGGSGSSLPTQLTYGSTHGPSMVRAARSMCLLWPPVRVFGSKRKRSFWAESVEGSWLNSLLWTPPSSRSATCSAGDASASLKSRVISAPASKVSKSTCAFPAFDLITSAPRKQFAFGGGGDGSG